MKWLSHSRMFDFCSNLLYRERRQNEIMIMCTSWVWSHGFWNKKTTNVRKVVVFWSISYRDIQESMFWKKISEIWVFLEKTKMEYWSISHRKTLYKYKNHRFLKQNTQKCEYFGPASKMFMEILSWKSRADASNRSNIPPTKKIQACTEVLTPAAVSRNRLLRNVSKLVSRGRHVRAFM